MFEEDSNENFELSPSDFLNLVRRPINFCLINGVHLTGFVNELCRLNTTFSMR